jgi:hypothetical protein
MGLVSRSAGRDLGLLGLVVVLVVVGGVLAEAPWHTGFLPGIQAVFHGADGERLSITPFLATTILTVGPAFVAQRWLTDRLTHGLYAELVRHGSPTRWIRRWLGRLALTSLLTWLTALAAYVAVAAVSGLTWPADARPVIAYFVGAGTLQSMVYGLLFALVTFVWRSKTAGFWVIPGIAILSTPPFVATGLLPAAVNSLSRTLSEQPLLFPLGLLAAWVLLLAGAIALALRTGDMNFD